MKISADKMAAWDAAKQEVLDALADLNAKLAEADAIRAGIAAEIESHFGKQPDEWQESDAGVAFEEWLAGWQDLDLSDVRLEDADELERDQPSEAKA